LATPIDRRHLPDGAWKFEDLRYGGAATRIVDGVPPLLVTGSWFSELFACAVYK